MAQSGTLAAFFAPEGELDDAFREAFPVRLGVHDLVYCCRLSVKPGEDAGDDLLHATFQVMTWDAARTRIENIVEQELPLLWLAPAVADDVYRIRGFRFCIRPDTVKARLRRFVRGLPALAVARYAASGGTAAIVPHDVL